MSDCFVLYLLLTCMKKKTSGADKFTNNIQRETKDSLFNKEKINILKIEVNKRELDSEITLPLLDYFEELKNGVISTNVDPQLSHGVESLKAQLSNALDDEDDGSFEMIILRNNGNVPVRLEITENKHIREI